MSLLIAKRYAHVQQRVTSDAHLFVPMMTSLLRVYAITKQTRIAAICWTIVYMVTYLVLVLFGTYLYINYYVLLKVNIDLLGCFIHSDRLPVHISS